MVAICHSMNRTFGDEDSFSALRLCLIKRMKHGVGHESILIAMDKEHRFGAQLKDQFGLPAFPLMNTTSALCQYRYGWSFAEAQQIEQVRKSTKPMLFIHGDKDAFVPYAMLHPL